MLEDSRFVREVATARVRSAFEAAPATNMSIRAYGPDGPQSTSSDTDRFAVWAQGFGSWGSFDSDGNAAKYDHDTGGFFIGADGLIDETWRVGLLAGYSRSTFDLDGRMSTGSSDNYHVALYGGSQWGRSEEHTSELQSLMLIPYAV